MLRTYMPSVPFTSETWFFSIPLPALALSIYRSYVLQSPNSDYASWDSQSLMIFFTPLQWHHNGVSHHRVINCLLNPLFRHRSKKTSKLRFTDLCAENSPVTGELPAQNTGNAENVSIWCRAGVKYVLSNTNTNTNTPAKIWSNTNTNTNTAHQIQIQIHTEAKTKMPQF